MATRYERLLIKRYDDRLAKYGESPKALGWLKGRQTVRFTALTEIGEMPNSNILDVGCGFGDLHGFLRNLDVKVNYTGIDINPNLIAIAKTRYPNANFLVANITSHKIHCTFDWVIASGIFEFRYSGMTHLIRQVLSKMFELSEKGVAADFITSYVQYRDKHAFYAKPEVIFKLAKSLSRRVTLRHDYMPYEFCVYIYKDNAINSRNVFDSFDARICQKFGTDELFPIKDRAPKLG